MSQCRAWVLSKKNVPFTSYQILGISPQSYLNTNTKLGTPLVVQCHRQMASGLPLHWSSTQLVNRFRNLGYSRLYTARRTPAGAQPPGFTGIKIHNQYRVYQNVLLDLTNARTLLPRSFHISIDCSSPCFHNRTDIFLIFLLFCSISGHCRVKTLFYYFLKKNLTALSRLIIRYCISIISRDLLSIGNLISSILLHNLFVRPKINKQIKIHVLCQIGI